MTGTQDTLRNRLVRQLRKDPSTGCIVWTGYITEHGYGMIGIGAKRTALTHRVAAHLWLGVPLHEDHYVCHHCDNKPCCSPFPGHIYIGNHSTNMQDMWDRGLRSRVVPPSRRKLTMSQCENIRKEYFTTEISQKALGDQYGVTQQCISEVVRGVRYSSNGS